MPVTASDRALAERLADAAGDAIRPLFRAAYTQELKADRSPVTQADRAANFIARATDYAHPSVTTRMGTDPAQSIVGPDLSCHHVPNIAVVSASPFPTAGSANPTMTIMQLALHHANTLH